ADAVHQHLERCVHCQHDLQSLKAFDAHLQETLVLEPDLANKIPTVALTDTPNRSSWRVVSVGFAAVAAVAATILIGTWTFNQPSDTRPPIVARLVRATGAVEVQLPGSMQWNSVDQDDEASFGVGVRLRTGTSVLCEIETADQAKIRLNEAGEVVIRDSKEIELVRGQLWCLASDQSGIEIDVAVGGAKPPSIASFTCPSESEFQCDAEQSFASCDSVSLQNSQTEMSFGSDVCVIRPGETVSIDGNKQVQLKPSANAETKVWQLPLLAIGNPLDDELRSSLNRLLAPIGMTKARHLNEMQIRSLGPRGAIPLLAYALTETSPERLRLRRTAVSLASEVADAQSIEMLRQLTEDPDAMIAAQSQQALQRIVGQDQ
ncbi:MAG: HEAT repeat domain-containing protein, partial [Planctomycetales bacterium]|nr:HEAT repeat domain-containing protein [Planctomycetales bacterium]